MKEILHTIYSVSSQNLIEVWVDTMHADDFLVVVWDALTHIEYINDIGLSVNAEDVYNNKILTILVATLEDAFYVMAALSNKEKEISKIPFVQIYGLGKFITDNV